MTLDTRATNRMRKAAPDSDWRRRPLARAVVFLLSWWVFGVSYAVDFPSLPLQTGVVQPAPNIIFILDDSTSMTTTGGDVLDTGLRWSNTSPGLGSAAGAGAPYTSGAGAPYTKNALSYNPKITYMPWAKANSTNTDVERWDPAEYTAAGVSVELATGDTTDLSAGDRTYYVPKSSDNLEDQFDQRKYYRYVIRSGGAQLVRAEWSDKGATDNSLGCPNGAGFRWRNCTNISVDGDAATGVRALEAEKQNYANWYQYHRTRMKAAKAGSSEAFATLDENYRVGLMGLYPSGSDQQVLGGSMNNIIPVETNGGLFVGDNRKNWFDHLHGMTAKRYTPLRKALDGAGRYFTSPRAYRSVTNGDISYLACRQNFAILTTDGYWNNIGGEDPNSAYGHISGDDKNGNVISGPNNQSFQYQRAAPYWYNGLGDYNDQTTLADIAMHYWKTDLLTTDVSGFPGSSDNRVPFSVSNPAFWQHMVTFGVGLGVRGRLTDAQVAHAVAGTGNSQNGGYWRTPVRETGTTENPENVDDLRHAALNSRGSYINANDAEEFSKGITDALSRIGERRGSASNVLANSTSISTESFVYQATYTAGSWRGELLAYPISSAGLGQPEWRAGERIAAWGSRKVFTADTVSGGSTFPNTAQSSALSAAAATLGLGVNNTELAQYLRGDATNEKRNGGLLRDRVMRSSTDQIIPALLGDIVDSSPFYAPDIQTLFVGANDGMLHAIDASNTVANTDNTSGGGTERFTYIPRGVDMNQLAELADPLYGSNTTTKPHRYFVDGPIVVSARERTPGRNYLIGALGRGGRGVYGLDVTNPAAFNASHVLWDNTGSDVPDNMGNVIAEPLISRLNNGMTAAVVANGPNSVTGTASLFIMDLDTGVTIQELNTNTSDNGLSAPRAVDVNADGLIDYFFAGDLRGNLWRFDVTSSNSGDWAPVRVFTARDASNNEQPITGGVGVARDPSTDEIWVFFGTGSYMTSGDQDSTSTQSYYGVMVGQSAAEGVNLTRSDLQPRAIHVVDAATGARAFEPSQGSVGASYHGWYIDLNNPLNRGERVISAPLIYDNILVFSSIVPPLQDTVNSCEAGGSGYVNALDAFSGTSLPAPFFEVGPDTIADPDGGEDLPIGSLPISAGMPTAPIIIGDKLVIGDSSGGVPTDIDVSPPGGNLPRRVSWRELFSNL